MPQIYLELKPKVGVNQFETLVKSALSGSELMEDIQCEICQRKTNQTKMSEVVFGEQQRILILAISLLPNTGDNNRDRHW